MNPLAAAVRITWTRNAAYGTRLIEDLPPAHFIAQPPGLPSHIMLNHPAWIISHLNVYAPIAACLCRGEPFADPLEHPFGQKSKPIADMSVYASKDALIAEWKRLHDDGAVALAAASDATVASPNPLERWRTQNPTVGDMLVTLMVKHETGHLGQLSAWRRAMGMPSVPM